MKAKQISWLDGWCILPVVVLAAFGLVLGCQQDAVAPHGTVVLEIHTVFADPAPVAADGDVADVTPGLATASVDRVVATVVNVASGEILGETELAVSGSTASGQMSIEIFGQVEAELQIQMFDGGSLAWLGASNLMLAPNLVLEPEVMMNEAPASGVRGRVENANNGDPIAGATATLAGTSWSAVTGSTGEFVLEADPGIYTLQISATGFHPADDRQVTVTDTTMTDIGVVTMAPSTTPTSGISGWVQNSQTSAGIFHATVLLVESGVSVLTATGGEFELLVDPGDYTMRVTAPGFEPAPDTPVTVVADSVISVGVVRLNPSSNPSGVRGTVEHANLEQPIAGATVLLVEPGISVLSTTSGDFELIANPGDYTMRVSASGFIATERAVVIPAGEIVDVGVVALVPQQSEDEIVIVLSWGVSPADLDAHLYGPAIPPDTARFHVYYSNQGSRESPPYATLDRDDQSSYGPETVVIVQRFTGTYNYMVHDYTNRGSSPDYPSEALSNSGARVRVIVHNQETHNITIPTGVGGSLWRVLDIDGASGTVEIRNTLEYAGPGFAGEQNKNNQIFPEGK